MLLFHLEASLNFEKDAGHFFFLIYKVFLFGVAADSRFWMKGII